MTQHIVEWHAMNARRLALQVVWLSANDPKTEAGMYAEWRRKMSWPSTALGSAVPARLAETFGVSRLEGTLERVLTQCFNPPCATSIELCLLFP